MEDNGLAVIERVALVMPDIVKRVGLSMGYSFSGDAGPADGYAQDAIDEIHATTKILGELGDPALNEIITELAAAADEVWLKRESAHTRLLKAKEMIYHVEAERRQAVGR